MRSQTIIFLSMMTAIYFISNLIPFNIGEPLWIFFGVLFSYFVGSICIAYIYVLHTFWLILNVFYISAIGEIVKEILMVDPNIIPAASLLPGALFAVVMMIGTYLGVYTGIRVCRALIKKLHIVERFVGAHI